MPFFLNLSCFPKHVSNFIFLYVVCPFSYNFLFPFFWIPHFRLISGGCYIAKAKLISRHWLCIGISFLECKLYHLDQEINEKNLSWVEKVTVCWQNVTNFAYTYYDCFLQFKIPCAIKSIYVKVKPFSWDEMIHIQLYQNSSSMTLDFRLHHLCIYWIWDNMQQKSCFQFLVIETKDGSYKQTKPNYKCFRLFRKYWY